MLYKIQYKNYIQNYIPGYLGNVHFWAPATQGRVWFTPPIDFAHFPITHTSLYIIVFAVDARGDLQHPHPLLHSTHTHAQTHAWCLLFRGTQTEWRAPIPCRCSRQLVGFMFVRVRSSFLLLAVSAKLWKAIISQSRNVVRYSDYQSAHKVNKVADVVISFIQTHPHQKVYSKRDRRIQAHGCSTNNKSYGADELWTY